VRPDGFMAVICDDAAIDATLSDLCTRMGC